MFDCVCVSFVNYCAMVFGVCLLCVVVVFVWFVYMCLCRLSMMRCVTLSGVGVVAFFVFDL